MTSKAVQAARDQNSLPVGKNRTKAIEITPAMIESIVAEYYGKTDTVQNIAKKYNVSVMTVHRYAKKNAHLKDTFAKGQRPQIVREGMSELERLKLLSEDSMTVVELTIALLRHRLQAELAAANAGLEITNKIKMNELGVIIAEITPYIMDKKGAKKGSKEEVEAKRQKAVSMFKKAI